MCNVHATFTLPSACLLLGVSICQKPQGESSPGSKAKASPQAGFMYLLEGVWVGREQGRWRGRGGQPRLAPGRGLHARRTLPLGSGGALMRETW